MIHVVSLSESNYFLIKNMTLLASQSTFYIGPLKCDGTKLEV